MEKNWDTSHYSVNDPILTGTTLIIMVSLIVLDTFPKKGKPLDQRFVNSHLVKNIESQI